MPQNQVWADKMCDWGLDGPKVFEEVARVARKEHICCACGETVRKGDQYIYSTGLWENGWEHFKHCLRCRAILNELYGVSDSPVDLTLSCGEDWQENFGDLPEYVAGLAFLTSDEAQEKLRWKTVEITWKVEC